MKSYILIFLGFLFMILPFTLIIGVILFKKGIDYLEV